MDFALLYVGSYVTFTVCPHLWTDENALLKFLLDQPCRDSFLFLTLGRKHFCAGVLDRVYLVTLTSMSEGGNWLWLLGNASIYTREWPEAVTARNAFWALFDKSGFPKEL